MNRNRLAAPLLSALLSAIFFASIGCGGGSDSHAQISYVALGASDATGVGADPINEGYVFEIAEGVRQQGYSTELLNLGIPGAEADEIKNIELEALLGVQDTADLVTIFTGPNDIVSGRAVENFEGNIQTILSELREKTSAYIVISNIPDLTQLPRFVEEPSANVTFERVVAFNQAISRQAAVYNVPIVDSFSEPIDAFLVSGDGFHPSNEGHELIAQRFLELIKPVLPSLVDAEN